MTYRRSEAEKIDDEWRRLVETGDEFAVHLEAKMQEHIAASESLLRTLRNYGKSSLEKKEQENA